MKSQKHEPKNNKNYETQWHGDTMDETQWRGNHKTQPAQTPAQGDVSSGSQKNKRTQKMS
jgi:hypothetical protein